MHEGHVASKVRRLQVGIEAADLRRPHMSGQTWQLRHAFTACLSTYLTATHQLLSKPSIPGDMAILHQLGTKI